MIYYGLGEVSAEAAVPDTQVAVLDWLDQLGFPTPERIWTGRTHDDLVASINELDADRHELDYETDGAVIKLNPLALREQCGATAKAPRWAIAYKYAAEQAETVLKKITVQEMSREQLEESIKWEAEQYIPFDVNEVNLDFQILETARGEGQMDVLLVAAKKDLLDDYVQVIAEAGYTAHVVDIAGFAIENAYEANMEPGSDEVIGLANIGSQVTNINVVANGVPVFTRDVALGGSLYTEEIQKTLSIGFDEAEKIKIGDANVDSKDVVPKEVEEAMRQVTSQITGEIARSLEFYSATAEDGTIGKVVLAGGSAQVSGLAATFEDRMDVPVEVMNPVERLTVGSGVDVAMIEDLSPALAVGVGLAMRRLDEQ